ncbi:hypothetical protein LXL04_019845 [Taraxacum kok-saghyz]
MAASRSYLGRGNYQHLFGEREGPMATDLRFNEFDVWNVSSSPDFHKTLTGSRILKNSAPVTKKREPDKSGFSLSRSNHSSAIVPGIEGLKLLKDSLLTDHVLTCVWLQTVAKKKGNFGILHAF